MHSSQPISAGAFAIAPLPSFAHPTPQHPAFTVSLHCASPNNFHFIENASVPSLRKIGAAVPKFTEVIQTPLCSLPNLDTAPLRTPYPSLLQVGTTERSFGLTAAPSQFCCTPQKVGKQGVTPNAAAKYPIKRVRMNPTP